MRPTGTIGAPEDAAEAQRLVQAFVGKDANVISRLRMATPLQVNLQVRFAEVSRSLVKSLGVKCNPHSSGGFQFGVTQAARPQYAPGAASSAAPPLRPDRRWSRCRMARPRWRAPASCSA
jgi:pilus assembly protein CpaC